MKFTNFKIILMAFAFLLACFSNLGFAGDCGNDDDSMQMLSDCYGNCCPMAWVFDDICDNGVRDWPVDSGIYIYLDCQEFYCDLYQCEGCTLECPEGQAPDCNGNCAPVEWITDDICDVGQRTFNGNAIVLACQEYGCDAQTCDGVCWEHYGEWSLDNIGACCDGDSCSELTRSDCWELGYTFMGSNTQCQTNTCLCGEGWIADCNGNCLPFRTAAGGYCSHGEYFDPDGIYDNGDEFYIDLDCQALACGLSGCIGNCPGACCAGGECVVTDTWHECLELGGVFLGSYASCGEGGSACNAELKTIQLPDTELYWSGNLGNVEAFPQWIDIAGDVLVAGSAVWNDDYGIRLGLCVYRYDSSKDDWIEEALIELPENRYPTFDNDFCYSTDGNRIAVTSIVEPEGKNARKVIDIYANDGDGWYFEDSVDEGIPFGDDEMNSFPSSIDILGDVLIAGHSSMNEDSSKNNFGAVFLYHFNNGVWEKEDTIESIADGSLGQVDRQFGLSVALGDGIAAIMSEESLSVFDISSGVGVGVKYFNEISSHNHPRSKGLDIDSKTNRIMSPVGDPFSNWSVMGSGIYEYDGMDWVLTAVLSPFDYVANDAPGYIVDIEGDTALITSPRDDDLGYDTGSAYLWRHDGTSWVFKAKLWSDWADAGDQFGIGAALHDSSAYITGNLESDGDCIKIFSPRQTAWINPEGGSLEDADNWDPHLPASDESVLFSLRSDTNILVSDDFPFDHMFVGPGDYTFDLQGTDRIFDSSGHALSLQGVPGLQGVFALTDGTLTVNGDIHIGEDELPGGISLRDKGEDSEKQSRIIVNGTWLQHEAGELDVTLRINQDPAVQIMGEQAPRIGGVLSLNIADDYIPVSGHQIPIMTTETVDSDTDRFHLVMINDPLPEGLYMKIGYRESYTDSAYETYAVVDSLDSLFGYGNENGADVEGIATSVAVG
ncbi:MAG: FG-GAP repeat protein, partial [Phycisphaerales bacterium]|nr:FG-GAP repeat protein [Phycisphaerales bacterium]